MIFLLLYSTAFLVVVLITITLLYLPRLLRRNKMRTVAKKFALMYQINSRQPFSWRSLIPLSNDRWAWKENIISGTINGHHVEVFDSFAIGDTMASPGASVTRKETISLIDGHKKSLPASIPGIRGVSSIKFIEDLLGAL